MQGSPEAHAFVHFTFGTSQPAKTRDELRGLVRSLRRKHALQIFQDTRREPRSAVGEEISNFEFQRGMLGRNQILNTVGEVEMLSTSGRLGNKSNQAERTSDR